MNAKSSRTVADTQSDSPARDATPLGLFLMREWPYLAMLILALFGVASASVVQRRMTTYWLVLAPFIGVSASLHAGKTSRGEACACG